SETPGLPRAERDRRGRLERLGSGARALFRPRLGRRLCGVARDPRSRRAPAPGRAARGPARQGDVRLHGTELFPTAAGRRAGRVSALCQSADAEQTECSVTENTVGTGEWSLTVRSAPTARAGLNHSPLPTPFGTWRSAPSSSPAPRPPPARRPSS